VSTKNQTPWKKRKKGGHRGTTARILERKAVKPTAYPRGGLLQGKKNSSRKFIKASRPENPTKGPSRKTQCVFQRLFTRKKSFGKKVWEKEGRTEARYVKKHHLHVEKSRKQKTKHYNEGKADRSPMPKT